jgi:hypothetical protein
VHRHRTGMLINIPAQKNGSYNSHKLLVVQGNAARMELKNQSFVNKD